MGAEYLALVMVGALFAAAAGRHSRALRAGGRRAACSVSSAPGESLFNLLPLRIYGVVTNYTLLAIPLFVFMGVMLEKSRLAERMLEVIGHLSGQRPGGMALAIIAFGVVMGASTGIVAATVVTVGLISLPTLLARGYDKRHHLRHDLRIGHAGPDHPAEPGADHPVGYLRRIGGHAVRRGVDPEPDARGAVSGLPHAWWRYGSRSACRRSMPTSGPAMSASRLLIDLAKVVLPPIALIILVLGSIIGGVAAPTEAASMGALGAIVLVLCSGRHELPRDARDGAVDVQGHRYDAVRADRGAGLQPGLPRAGRRRAGRSAVRVAPRRGVGRHRLHGAC